MADGLLLLHAFPLSAAMWEPQLSALGRQVTIVAPDLPGFGTARPARGGVMSMEAAASAAARAADRAGLDGLVVCGLSMGGYVALAFYRRYKQRVRGLVLANTRAEGDDAAGKERREALAARLRSEGNVLADAPPPLLSQSAPPELLDRVKRIIRQQPAEAIAAAALGMARRRDATRDLATVGAPTLVVTSTGDSLIPKEASIPMAGAIPGARLAVIEGAGHLSNLEAPEEFNRLLSAHLQACGLLPR